MIDGPRRAPLQGPARQLVVFLHGYGADGNDLIGIADEWRHELPHAAFASPHAPEPFPFGPFGRQWFALRNGIHTPPDERRRGLASATAALDKFLDAELARLSLDNRALALVGFSQGGAVALIDGLARPAHALVSFSGALWEVPDAVTSPPPQVFLAHGDADDVVPVVASVAAAKALAERRVSVRSRTVRGLGHGIDGESAAEAARFLQEAFAATS